jgi:hypothetical protein
LHRRHKDLKWSWADGNGAKFRHGLQILGLIYELDLDGLKLTFGKKFQYQMRKRIFCFGQNSTNNKCNLMSSRNFHNV